MTFSNFPVLSPPKKKSKQTTKNKNQKNLSLDTGTVRMLPAKREEYKQVPGKYTFYIDMLLKNCLIFLLNRHVIRWSTKSRLDTFHVGFEEIKPDGLEVQRSMSGSSRQDSSTDRWWWRKVPVYATPEVSDDEPHNRLHQTGINKMVRINNVIPNRKGKKLQGKYFMDSLQHGECKMCHVLIETVKNKAKTTHWLCIVINHTCSMCL